MKARGFSGIERLSCITRRSQDNTRYLLSNGYYTARSDDISITAARGVLGYHAIAGAAIISNNGGDTSGIIVPAGAAQMLLLESILQWVQCVVSYA